MKRFDLIRDLVKSLREGEARTFEKFLNAFDDVKSEDSLKMLKAFRLLRNEDITEQELQKKLSDNYSKESFSKLLLRLKDRIYDTLTLDSNILRKDAYSELYQKKLHVRKLTSVASIVHGRGNLPLAIELYEKIVVICKEFEVYDELIETLFILQQLKGITEGIEIYKNLGDQVQFYDLCRKELMKAKHYYYELIARIEFTASADKEAELLNDRCEELEKSLALTNSCNIEYFLLYLRMHQAQVSADYKLAAAYNSRLVNLVKNEKAVYNRRALGSALLELGNNLLLSSELVEANEALTEALKNLNKNSINSFVALEVLFYCSLYLNNLDEAENHINTLLTNDYHKNAGEFLQSRRTFLKAVVHFLQGNYVSVHMLLQDCREIETDKEGWIYGIRLLSIYNDIERNLLDQADNKIESLRKFISRSKVPVDERFVISYRLLYQLAKNSFDFTRTHALNRELFDLLENTHKWRIKTAEIFPIEKWFRSKMENKEYKFTISTGKKVKKILNEN